MLGFRYLRGSSRLSWWCQETTASDFQWDYSLTRARILLGIGFSRDLFSAADKAPVLSTGVIARGTTLSPLYPLTAAPAFHAPEMGSSVSPILCLHPFAPVACDPSWSWLSNLSAESCVALR